MSKQPPATVEVRVLVAGTVYNGHAHKKGDLVQVDPGTAHVWTHHGRATYTVRVRALVPTFDGSTSYDVGAEWETSDGRATHLHNAGQVHILSGLTDRSGLKTPRDLVKPVVEPPDPYHGERRFRVNVLDHILFDSVCYSPGEKPVHVDLPESAARRHVAAGHAEWVGSPPGAIPGPMDVFRAVERVLKP